MRTLSTRWGLLLCAAAAWLAAAPAPAATTFNIVPLDLGDGYRVSGTLTTDGTIGALAPANFTAWNIEAALTSVLARYTPSNTKAQILGRGSRVGRQPHRRRRARRLDRRRLAALPLAQRLHRPLGAAGPIAASSSPSGGTGVLCGWRRVRFPPAQGSLLDASSDVAAKESAPGSSVFDLVPLAFGGGVTMSGNDHHGRAAGRRLRDQGLGHRGDRGHRGASSTGAIVASPSCGAS